MLKLILFAIMTFGLGASAFADGFICQSVSDPVEVRIFNHVNPNEGTRRAAVMVLSDLEVSRGRKTIAVFRDRSRTLNNRGATYIAKIDRRVPESSAPGEAILGTRIGSLKRIIVRINFRFGEVLPFGARRSGKMTLVKRNGDIVENRLVCKRYLKNRPSD